jgi:hopanoid-associated phosphorylase
LSFGLAGGLSPDLRSGDLVLGSHVLEQSERHDVHSDWHSAILSASKTMRVRHGGITGHDAVVARAADKAALHVGSGAVAVDMESHIAALYAHKHGLPFAIIRVISDPVTRSLPPIASDALKPDGNIDLTKVLKGIARNPGQLPALIAAGFDSGRAFASLRRVRGILGPLFGLRLTHL